MCIEADSAQCLKRHFLNTIFVGIRYLSGRKTDAGVLWEGKPKVLGTSMPQMTMPGTTSRVFLTTMSSAEFMSRADMPGAPVTMPSFARRFTPAAKTQKVG